MMWKIALTVISLDHFCVIWYIIHVISIVGYYYVFLYQMPDLSWQYSSLGLILVCMSRAKAAIEYITKSCKEEKVQTWRSFFTDKFMQVGIF